MESQVQVHTVPVPENLTTLLKASAKGKSNVEYTQIHTYLLKSKVVFSRAENYLEQTNLVEHTFATGDARPIKQSPRCLSMVFADEGRMTSHKLH